MSVQPLQGGQAPEVERPTPMSLGEAQAEALARRWIEASADDADVSSLGPDDRRALARSIKALCNQHWNSDPEFARQAAARLRQLMQMAEGPCDPLLHALAVWADALADLTHGRMQEALQGLEQARTLLLDRGEVLEAARCLLPRMVVLVILGRHDEALVTGETARRAFIELHDTVSAGKVDLNLGSMLLRLDRHAEAADVYRKAAVLFAQVEDPLHSVMADIGLASACSGLFDFDEAIRLYERASRRVQARGLSSLQGVIDTNQGRLELLLGRHASALRRLNAALREAEAHGLPQDVAEARRDLADAYLALNLLPEAIALYEQTLEICQRTQAPVEAAWARVQKALGMGSMGEPAAALPELQQARVDFLEAGHQVGAAVADLRSAELRLRMNQTELSLKEAQTAAASFRSLGVESWRWEAQRVAAAAQHAMGQLEASRSGYEDILRAGTAQVEVRTAARSGLALVLRALGQRDAARAHFEAAILATEEQRAALPGDEFRTAYGADKQAPYDALVEMALDEAPTAASSLPLLQAVEQARSPALRIALSRRDEASTVNPRLRERWQWLQVQWQQAIAEDDRSRSAALQSRLASLERDWLEQVRRQQASADARPGAGPHHPHPAFETLDGPSLLKAMPADTALVAFGWIGDRIVACGVTSSGIAHVEFSASGLAERIEQLRFQIDTLRFGAAALKAHAARMVDRCKVHLRALHDQMWRPVEPLLGGRDRVVIVPHRALHYLPFAALHDGRQHLVERLTLSFAPSVGLWGGGPARDTVPLKHLAAFGVGGPGLPHVGREIREVAMVFASAPGRSASVRLEGDATLPALRADLTGADVLHVACHGQFRADNPYFSALHLADGPLTVRDAAELPIQARLVVLSACETSLSKVAPGDEQLGLLRGFLMAGAPRVLATQWTVDDAGTRDLMTDYYRMWLEGLEPAAALRAAQCRSMMRNPHPYHWAAFALHERA